MDDEKEQHQEDDAEAAEDLEIGDDDADDVTGGTRSNPDVGGHFA